MNLIQTVSLHAGKKRRRALQAGVAEHEALQAEVEKQLMKIFKSVNRGRISAEDFKHRFQRQLVKAYEDAFKTGKGEEKLTAKDRRWINSYAAEQFEYLEGLADDIASGSEVNEARVGLYAKGSQAAYWQGAVSDYDGAIDWVLGPNDNNCEDCVELEEGSPYEPGELRTTPGAGDTLCLGNCHCSLVEAQ